MRKVKEISIVMLVLLGLVMASYVLEAQPIDFVGGKTEIRLATKQDGWVTLGTFDAGAANTPGVAARTAATFDVTDTNNITFEIKPGWNGVRIRLSTTTAADSTVTDVFLMSSVSDHYNRVATLTWVTGTQTATTSGEEYADAVVETNANWHKASSIMSIADADYIAEWSIDVMGSKMIGLCPTTYAHATTVEITGY